MSPQSKKNQGDPLVAVARKKVEQWREQDNFTMQELQTTGLSRAVIYRILSNEKGWLREEWLCALAKLFNRINAKLPDEKRRSWQDVFGEGFPVPPLRPDSALSNYADVARSELRRRARPLAEFLDAEFSIAADQQNVWKASQLLIRLCELYELTAEWSRAADRFAILAELNRTTGDFHYAADALLRRGIALFYDGMAAEAETSFRKGLDLLTDYSNKIPPPRTQLRLLNYLAMARSEQGDHAQARNLLETKSLRLAKDRGSDAALASVWNRLGVVCLKLDDVPAAFDYLVKALERRTELKMRSEAARTLLTLGAAHERLGALPEAIAVWKLSATLQKKLGDHEWLARTCYELGRGYAQLSRTTRWPESSMIMVTLSKTNFPDVRELRALKALSDQQSPVILRRERLAAQAHGEFEAAISWDTQGDNSPCTSLAREELEKLRETKSATFETAQVTRKPKKAGKFA